MLVYDEVSLSEAFHSTYGREVAIDASNIKLSPIKLIAYGYDVEVNSDRITQIRLDFVGGSLYPELPFELVEV